MIYAVSDLHGCYDKYTKLLERLHMTSDDSLYILGDIGSRQRGNEDFIGSHRQKKCVFLSGQSRSLCADAAKKLRAF